MCGVSTRPTIVSLANLARLSAPAPLGHRCSDLAQHGVVLVVTGAAPSIRPLLLAHGVPLPPAPLSWPPEMEAPQPAGGHVCGLQFRYVEF